MRIFSKTALTGCSPDAASLDAARSLFPSPARPFPRCRRRLYRAGVMLSIAGSVRWMHECTQEFVKGRGERWFFSALRISVRCWCIPTSPWCCGAAATLGVHLDWTSVVFSAMPICVWCGANTCEFWVLRCLCDSGRPPRLDECRSHRLWGNTCEFWVLRCFCDSGRPPRLDECRSRWLRAWCCDPVLATVRRTLWIRIGKAWWCLCRLGSW